jgi:predicted helicase
VFRAFVKAGQRLAEVHVQYEQHAERPLTRTEKAGEKLDYHVTKMKLSKDKSSLIYNQFLTLRGIPNFDEWRRCDTRQKYVLAKRVRIFAPRLPGVAGKKKGGPWRPPSLSTL